MTGAFWGKSHEKIYKNVYYSLIYVFYGNVDANGSQELGGTYTLTLGYNS